MRYLVGTVLLGGLLVAAIAASYQGWGLESDAAALQKAKSVRTGSLHARRFAGGGPGSGK